MRNTFEIAEIWVLCLLMGLLLCVAYDIVQTRDIPLCLEPLEPLLLQN